MAAAAPGDDSLIWALDRFIDAEGVTADVISEKLLPAVVASPEDLPDGTRARLLLRLLEADLAVGRVDATTLEYLQRLAACDLEGFVDPVLFAPLPGLLLRMKTELGLQTFRPGTALALKDAEAALNALFGNATSEEEVARHRRLHAALRNPQEAAVLQAEFPFLQLVTSALPFAARARFALRPVLQMIQDDIHAGRYMPGEGTLPGPAAAAAAAAPPSPLARPPAGPSPSRRAMGGAAAAAPAPAARLQGLADLAVAEGEEEYDGPYDMAGHEPQQQQQQQQQPPSASHGQRVPTAGGQPAVVQQLHARLGDLAQQGGQDPLPEMLGAAAGAAAAAATAGGDNGAVAAARGGRAVIWGEDSPAVNHAPPELQYRRIPQHSPLVPPPSGSRQQARRSAGGAAAAEAAEPRPEPSDGTRRKPKFWTPEEEVELVRLVKVHGRGTWATIVKEGAPVFQGRRKQVDLKDKWRNLIKQNRIQPHEMAEIEAVEAVLREELAGKGKRRQGRPARTNEEDVTPATAKRQRRRRGEEEGEEEEDEDSVEDADDAGERRSGRAAQQRGEEEEEGEEEHHDGEEEEEEEGGHHNEEEEEEEEEDEEGGKAEEGQDEEGQQRQQHKGGRGRGRGRPSGRGGRGGGRGSGGGRTKGVPVRRSGRQHH